MEPASDQREHPNFLDSHGYFFDPQWSPLRSAGKHEQLVWDALAVYPQPQ
jgi:hypothetical protein